MGTGTLTEPLQESDKQYNLPLGGGGEGVPLFRWGSGELGDVASGILGGGEVDAVGLDDVTDKGSHGDTAVLDLGLTEPGDGGVLGL